MENASQRGIRLALPQRHDKWRPTFDSLALGAMTLGCSVLDVGAGRRPLFLPDSRPPCHYVGLDLSRRELDLAPAGAYDEAHESDVSVRCPELEGRFDVAISWQVLEHVKPLDRALENIRSYLKPGGRFIATLSGKFALFALINQSIPRTVGVVLLTRLLNHDPAKTFPAYYHKCWQGALQRSMTQWSHVRIVPWYLGSHYLTFSPIMFQAYLRLEGRLQRHPNLATHYMIDAVK